jgi:hypothetical protein
MQKPILFNTEMVNAIQDGRKTVTRRVIRWERDQVIKVAQARGKLFAHFAADEQIPEQIMTWYMDRVLPRPYEVGDVLWVRETWDFLPCIVCRPNSECCEIAPDAPDQMETADGLTDGCFLYKAIDGDDPLAWEDVHKWRPAIHMPRQAARIFLRVTGVAAERLCDIDEAGANAEGLYKGWQLNGRGTMAVSARQAFMWLWQSLTRKGPIKHNWALNPWVWVIRFECCERPEGWPGT